MSAQESDHALVFLGAALPSPDIISDLEFSLVIGVDRGIDHALSLGLTVTDAVGDFDSVSALGLAHAKKTGARIQQFDAKKDSTDLELGLNTALLAGAKRITVVGAYDTSRLDHQVANLLLLADERYADVDLQALIGQTRIFVVRKSTQIDCEPQQLVTLLAIGGPAQGVTTTGLEYPLRSETLSAHSSRGVSNVARDRTIGISLEDGVLLAFLPGPES